MNIKLLYVALIIIFFDRLCLAQYQCFEKIGYKGKSKIEVGSFYAGAEFHNSCPVPQRISFYYPVANSIDLSNDYWNRDTTFAMNAGIQYDEEILWLSNFSFNYELTPYSVKFYKDDKEKLIEILYQFTKNKPSLVVTYSIVNKSNKIKDVELFTRLALSLKTSHTYAIKKNTVTTSINNGQVVLAKHLSSETQKTQLFILNTQKKPAAVLFNSSLNNHTNLSKYVQYKLVDSPAVNFIYRGKLKPYEKFIVAQIIGTCRGSETNNLIKYLVKNYKKEINDYENFILARVSRNKIIKTEDNWIDRTILWAKTILEVNKHYIDGKIVPMPSPAEYNFYFTHDVLMTDYAAVKFDISRVRKDLQFIINNADKEKIIPHAYYWKDSAYVTEYANYDNWNNCCFIIVAAEYLKYSKDVKFIKYIYPYLEKSLSTLLLTKGDDNLVYSYRPDWWDIGRNYGPRSYMTILTIKALRSFIYISSYIDENENKLLDYENLSDRIERSLNEKLWSDAYGYLMNYLKNNLIDEHYYCGPLLSAHFNLLDTSKVNKMIKTAKSHIVDDKIGVYTVYPMDFDELKIWNFAGDEAGQKYYYLNGGIWFHSNAWYALALIAADKKEEAFEFIKNTMTIDGIMNSPNGQPAMYEVRNSNYHNLNLCGTVDKPQFLWAASWYLYTLYHLFLLNNNHWNIKLNPYLRYEQKRCFLNVNINEKSAKVIIKRAHFLDVSINGKNISSFIIPSAIETIDSITLSLGAVKNAFLKSTNSILEKINYYNNNLSIKLKAFKGHKNKTTIISEQKPKEIKSNNSVEYFCKRNKDSWIIGIYFTHKEKEEELKIEF